MRLIGVLYVAVAQKNEVLYVFGSLCLYYIDTDTKRKKWS